MSPAEALALALLEEPEPVDEPLEEPDFELEPLLAAGAGPGVAEPEDEAEPLVAVALPELELEKEPITHSKSTTACTRVLSRHLLH